MTRIFAVCVLCFIVVACWAGMWVATRPPMALFVVPGATDVQIDAQSWSAWQIRYHAPGTPATWYTDVGKTLEAQHWGSPDQAGYGSLTRTYSRATSFGLYELWEWAYLTFDPFRPNDVHIHVRRWIGFP